jgi:hypothetical protein
MLLRISYVIISLLISDNIFLIRIEAVGQRNLVLPDINKIIQERRFNSAYSQKGF